MKQLRQSGQAMLELTIMLLILSAMILGVVMLAGIEITSNTMLLSARNNAQNKALNSDSDNDWSSGSEYKDWDYTTLRITRSHIEPGQNGSLGGSTTLLRYNRQDVRFYTRNSSSVQIPFTYQSHSSKNHDEETLAGANSGLTGSYYSRWKLPLWERYEQWRSPGSFDPSFTGDFSENIRSGNGLDAARLVSASGSGSERPATINASHQAGPNSSRDAAKIMYDTFYKFFGIRIDDLRLSSHETNVVHMPAQ